MNRYLALKSNYWSKGEDITGSAVGFTKTSVTKLSAVKSALKMSDSLIHGFKMPPDQQAIRDRCFHPSGTFVGFPIEDVETSIPARFEKIVRMYLPWVAFKTNDRSLICDSFNEWPIIWLTSCWTGVVWASGPSIYF